MNRPMTESERAAQQLAPGSRWDGDAVVDEDDVRTEVGLRNGHPSWVSVECDGSGEVAQVPDALAVIRAAGLDPEHAELVRLREAVNLAEIALTKLGCWRKESREYDDDMGCEHRIFDEEDVRLVEDYARQALDNISELEPPR